jgi:hypothetical protein
MVTDQIVLETVAENTQIVLYLLNQKGLVANSKENHIKMSIREKISEAKELAKYLTKNNLTLSIGYQGIEIIVLEKKAKLKFSKLITGNNNIQIKNARQLKKEIR